MKLNCRRSFYEAPFVCGVLLSLLLPTNRSHGKSRPPQPPWPETSLMTFGWDLPYWQSPLDAPALNEHLGTTWESWSGYALVRDNLPSTPVVIPPLLASGR